MKKIICILLCFIVFSLLSGCDTENKSFSEVYHINLNEINKIEVTNGQNGENTVTTEQNVINNFISDIKDIKIAQYKKTDVKGWLYSITFYNQNKKLMSFTTSEIEGKTKKDETKLVTAIETFLNHK
ncbi:hypothetical protein [Gottfriedia acidiceleris]|uniref:Lipoprotein n=1 Tax=Gottfriedia acidiceleris TaxID=371036 RepID=A0ABY4JLA9_9BACI|nr:hypothetical protein [Gottfriedia acidiceleris]UPM53688.1 hypothetical protein MY490_18180 [Gottfriedia acidiceleris]